MNIHTLMYFKLDEKPRWKIEAFTSIHHVRPRIVEIKKLMKDDPIIYYFDLKKAYRKFVITGYFEEGGSEQTKLDIINLCQTIIPSYYEHIQEYEGIIRANGLATLAETNNITTGIKRMQRYLVDKKRKLTRNFKPTRRNKR